MFDSNFLGESLREAFGGVVEEILRAQLAPLHSQLKDMQSQLTEMQGKIEEAESILSNAKSSGGFVGRLLTGG